MNSSEKRVRRNSASDGWIPETVRGRVRANVLFVSERNERGYVLLRSGRNNQRLRKAYRRRGRPVDGGTSETITLYAEPPKYRTAKIDIFDRVKPTLRSGH